MFLSDYTSGSRPCTKLPFHLCTEHLVASSRGSPLPGVGVASTPDFLFVFYTYSSLFGDPREYHSAFPFPTPRFLSL